MYDTEVAAADVEPARKATHRQLSCRSCQEEYRLAFTTGADVHACKRKAHGWIE